MVFSLTANVAPYLFEMEGKNFRVLDFFLRERMASPYELELTLASEDGVDFDDAVGKEALFTIKGKEADRHVHGVVHRLEQTGVVETAVGIRFHIYRAVIGPSLWLLSLERDCRIFQEKSVPDIVKTVLEEGGVSPDRISFRLQGAYEPRIYCVQYRETDLDFISRLLEEEGVFYYFEHDTDSHVMVFGDSVVNYQPVAGDPAVDFNPGDGLAADKEFIDRFTLSRGIRPARATLRDFNFEKPSLDLTCDDRTQCSFNKEIYDYPGEYTETAAGKKTCQGAIAGSRAEQGHGPGPLLLSPVRSRFHLFAEKTRAGPFQPGVSACGSITVRRAAPGLGGAVFRGRRHQVREPFFRRCGGKSSIGPNARPPSPSWRACRPPSWWVPRARKSTPTNTGA